MELSDIIAQAKSESLAMKRHQNAVINCDFLNRKIPNLKNLSAGAVQHSKLPLDTLSAELQKYAKTPYLKPDSSDLLETLLSKPNNNQTYDAKSLLNETVLTEGFIMHKSKRKITLKTTIAYYNRVNFTTESAMHNTTEKMYRAELEIRNGS
jgi:hypothetical protein